MAPALCELRHPAVPGTGEGTVRMVGICFCKTKKFHLTKTQKASTRLEPWDPHWTSPCAFPSGFWCHFPEEGLQRIGGSVNIWVLTPLLHSKGRDLCRGTGLEEGAEGPAGADGFHSGWMCPGTGVTVQNAPPSVAPGSPPSSRAPFPAASWALQSVGRAPSWPVRRRLPARGFSENLCRQPDIRLV